MKKLFASVAIASSIAAGIPSVAYAQFSMPSIPGMGKSSGGETADLGAQQDKLVSGFVAANKDVLNANSVMEQALGLKTGATASKATADALTEGATKDSLEAANKQVSASTEAVAAELAKGPKLDAQAKATFGLGLVTLASGVGKYIGLGKNVKDMASSLSSVSPMQLPKLQSAVLVVSKFPDALSSVSTALKNAIAFAKDNNIPVPADATKMLASL